jgi:hypothetical protein
MKPNPRIGTQIFQVATTIIAMKPSHSPKLSGAIVLKKSGGSPLGMNS